MRVLTEEETELFFEKLAKWLGSNIKFLIDNRERVYYLNSEVLKMASHVSKDDLLCAGTCFGKFTKSKKFKLNITCLDYLAKYAKYKVW
eukprot:CAMPEP_0176355744 /NCGR_PEP_ID=MMETSP0126-20121128/13512_1 /TAXON_ID=141414 ORGANISM="Strombidinopsis acuminatum, Strain SPMC142" /NCGR_SAMPLE_ID=MMETSP0126 /ASSEMBLY_ACC=CAM_ASM_000229 /LENGTH=88 /DNA_ID=CAMNT_0017708523 /DNA_START=13 /DNA_END=276 /DNA_ORIENTATION=+